MPVPSGNAIRPTQDRILWITPVTPVEQSERFRILRWWLFAKLGGVVDGSGHSLRDLDGVIVILMKYLHHG